MKKILILASLLVSTWAMAADQKILNIINTIENKNYDLIIEVDDSSRATGLKVYDQAMKDSKSYNMNNLKTGVVLKEQSGHKVIVLKGQSFDHDRGGDVKVDYLYNGITGSRKEMELEIQFDGKKWQVYSNGGRISNLRFKGKTVLGKVVGVASVEAF